MDELRISLTVIATVGWQLSSF